MKRTLIFCLISVITIISSGFKNDKIIITGDLKTGGNFDVYLNTTAGENSSRNTIMTKATNGKFSFEIDPVSVPTIAKIAFCGSDHTIILENKNISFSYSRESGYEIRGGFYNDLLFGWENSDEAKQINLQMYNLYKNTDIKSLSDKESEHFTSMSQNLRGKLVQLKKSCLNNLYTHKDPYVKLFAVIESGNRSDKEFEVLSGIREELPANADLQRIFKDKADVDKRAEIKKKLIVGADFIDMNAETISNTEVNLAKTIKQNKLTLLEFWASWCHPCREEMKKMPEVYTKFKSKGFEIFSFSMDEKKEAWQNASSNMDIPWINSSSDKTGIDQIAKIYAIDAIPKNFLLDQNGKIVALNIKADQLKPFLEEKLK